MKSLILFFIITLLATSCVQTRNRSAILKNGSSSDSATTGYDRTVNDDNAIPDFSMDNNSDTTSDNSSSSSSSNSIPSDATLCQTRTTNHLGVVKICKSSSDNLKIYVQVETPITSTKLCAIPMAEIGSSSAYIGYPRCRFFSDSSVYEIPLLKNRTVSYVQNLDMSAVMLIKDQNYNFPAPFATYQNMYGSYNGVDAFTLCAQILEQSGDSSYCKAFTSINQYVYHSFNKEY